MSSRKMFELVNFLHHELANDELSKNLPFAGKQITLVGSRGSNQKLSMTSDGVIPK